MERSSRLQTKLFLVPDLTRKNRTAISSKGTLISGAKAAQHIAAAEATGKHETGEVMNYTSHPAIRLYEREGYVKRLGLVSYAATRVREGYDSGAGDIRASTMLSLDIFSNTSTSLENMFLTQPPIKRVLLSNGIMGFSFKKTGLFVETGVKFGDVFEVVRSVADRGDRSPHVQLTFHEGIVGSAETRELAESAEELSKEDDPTRWDIKDGVFVMREGGFEF